MAKTFRIVDVIDGVPTLEVPIEKMWEDCKPGGAFKRLDPIEFITDRQRRWYKGVCLRDLVKYDENGETKAWWDLEVKSKCNGLAYLKKEGIDFELKLGDEVTRVTIGRITTKGVGKKNMTLFIEEILSKSMSEGWNIGPPDPDLRK